MKKGSFIGLITACILTSSSGDGSDSLGVREGKLRPCPDRPNCVSTQSERRRHAMTPLPYLQTLEVSREKILSIIKGIKRAKIIKYTETYIHAEFKTSLWHFVDDVEFFLDENARVVHFRSSSRFGYYDFGLNRRRMKEISEKYLDALEK